MPIWTLCRKVALFVADETRFLLNSGWARHFPFALTLWAFALAFACALSSRSRPAARCQMSDFSAVSASSTNVLTCRCKVSPSAPAASVLISAFTALSLSWTLRCLDRPNVHRRRAVGPHLLVPFVPLIGTLQVGFYCIPNGLITRAETRVHP